MTNDDPNSLVELWKGNEEQQAVFVMNALRDAGIDAVDASSNYAKVVWIETVALHYPWRVQVRRADYERARAVVADMLDTTDAQAIDWELIDVGEPEDAVAAEIAAAEAEDRVDTPGRSEESGAVQVPNSARGSSRIEDEPRFGEPGPKRVKPWRSKREKRSRAVKRLILAGIMGFGLWLVLPVVGVALEFGIHSVSPRETIKVHAVPDRVSAVLHQFLGGPLQLVAEYVGPGTSSLEDLQDLGWEVDQTFIVSQDWFASPVPSVAELMAQQSLPASQRKVYEIEFIKWRGEYALMMRRLGDLIFVVFMPVLLLVQMFRFALARDDPRPGTRTN